MNDDELDLVAVFVERRELDPELTAERFLAEHPSAGEGLRDALARLAAAEAMFPATSLHRPETVGRWRVVGELGRGGIGHVLRVVDESAPTAPERALKLLAPGTLADARAIRRMQREGELLRSIDHPGVVRILDVGDSEHGPWIVMEAIDGTSLAERLARARRDGETPPLGLDDGDDPWKAVARFGAALADAVAAAHAAGLLHRDVKPSNVLVGPDGAPVLIDFGLAVVEGSSTLTRTGDLIGTPHYMAPEQARGERADARTDVWGVGAVLYELCALRPPVEEREPLAAVETLRRRRPARLSGDGRVPAPLARIVDRALAFRPERRFERVDEIGEALRAFEDGRPYDVRPPSLAERIDDATRERPWLVPGALVGVLAVALALALSLRGEPDVPAGPDVDALRHGVVLAWLERSDDALAEAAVALEAAGRVEEARLALGLTGDAPLPIDSANPLVADLARAELARRDERYDDALAEFASTTERAGRWGLPAVALGRTAREKGDLERCESEWRAAIRLVPESAPLQRRLGKVRRQLGDIEGATACFREATRLDPDDWRNPAELARALAIAESPEVRLEALDVVREAQRLAPRPSRVLRNVEAALLDGLGRSGEAREIHLAILEDTPDHAATWFNLGLTYAADCLLADARAAFERSLELDARGSSPHVWLARIAVGSGCDLGRRCAEAGTDVDALADASKVVPHLAAALELDDGRTPALVDEAIALARAVGAEAALSAEMRRLVDARPIDETAVRWTRAIRDLDGER